VAIRRINCRKAKRQSVDGGQWRQAALCNERIPQGSFDRNAEQFKWNEQVARSGKKFTKGAALGFR
jgi:hypothetical protein